MQEKKIIMIIQHVRDILRQMTERYSSLLFDIQSTGGYNPEEDVLTPDWCSCQSCREMPSDVEKVCCGKSPDSCISRLPAFQVLILEVEVLVLMYVLLLNQEVKQRANRHQCYRRYMLWQHGRLGAGVRKVIPSCCVWRIRDRFPDRFGQYTGFVPGRLG
ncbi:P2X purinoceptor 7-like isoform X1 [Argopecten irradians]|uniref:P2X purinoceptor 7-like isoform X1 n=2 Tax=Argopecten irradians TaxID=31199 RepID=UPI00371E0689